MRETTGAGGERRFKANRIVRTLLDLERLSLSDIWKLYEGDLFTYEEMTEFYQLIGYNVGGYLELFPEEEIPEEGAA